MHILIIGAGRIGSTFAFHLSRAGHRVTVLARGARRQTLLRDQAIITTDAEAAPVEVLEHFDATMPYDLVLVTMLARQADEWLPRLAASSARVVLPLFNTFDGTARWRHALGPERFAFGFPSMVAFLVDGKLRAKVKGAGLGTTVTDARWARVFQQAGLPAHVEADMDSFLRSHVALFVPLMVSALWTWRRKAPLRWTEAAQLSQAWAEGFGVVQGMGHTLRPRSVAFLARRSRPLRTLLMWMFARSAGVTDLGEFGPTEARQLIDAMTAAAPQGTDTLKAIRP